MKHRLIAAGASLGLALMTTQLVAPAAHAARPVERTAAPTVTATVGDSSITLSRSNIRAGLITFKVVDSKTKGSAILQVLRLHPGYTLQQLGADINQAFSGDTAAIGRVDDNVTWLSGAQATAAKTGWFQQRLTQGQYVMIDQNGNGPVFTQLTVTGTVVKRTPMRTAGWITTYTYGFETSRSLPHNGWIRANNRADQPHFIELQRVKEGTTAKQIRQFIKSGGAGQPSWALRANSGIGVISPNITTRWKIDLPKGKYLVACFWPDRMDGMPHFFHGMWKLVHLS